MAGPELQLVISADDQELVVGPLDGIALYITVLDANLVLSCEPDDVGLEFQAIDQPLVIQIPEDATIEPQLVLAPEQVELHLAALCPVPTEAIVVASDNYEADCLASDSPGDCVRITVPSVGGIRQVTKIDPTAVGFPQIFAGIIVSKSTLTRCTVQRSGDYSVPYSVGLAPAFFVGLDGRLLAPPLPVDGLVWQAVAIGVDTDLVDLQTGWMLVDKR